MNIVEFSNFQDIPAQYEQFFVEQAGTSMFLTKLWFENLVANGLEENAVPYIIASEEPTTRLPKSALVMRIPAGQNGSIFSTWKLGMRTLAGLTSFQSNFYAPLLSPTVSERTNPYQCLANALSGRSAKWHLIDFNLLDPTNSSFAALASAFEKSGYRVGKYLYKGNRFEDIMTCSFKEYCKDRPKSSRRAIQNYQRKLRRLQTTKCVQIKVHSGDQYLDQVISSYEKIYTSSWKTPERFGQFSAGLIQSCAAEGSLRMVIVTLDDVPVAAEFAIVVERKATMMKTAYDPQFSKESIGAIAVMKAIEHLIDVDNVSSIDFGLDDDPYKSIWVRDRRERWGLVLFNRYTALGWFYWLRFSALQTIQTIQDKIKAAYRALFHKRPGMVG